MSLQLAHQSSLYGVSPLVKLPVALLLICLALAVGGAPFQWGLFAAMLLLSALTAKKGFGACLRMYRAPLPFILAGAAASAVLLEAGPAEGYFCVPLFGLYLAATPASVSFGAGLFAKSLACVSVLITLASSTPAEHLLWMMEKMRAPKALTELMLLVLRFLFLLLGLSKSLYAAQDSRLASVTFRARLRASASLASSVFVKSWLRSSDVARAMESRAYAGELTYIGVPVPLKARHAALGASLVAAASLAAALW